jgi:alkanesulfonate monooxygenase SsuD/methylene tetrahydromethanopterin reductase-like flavin-dependent oxidoreductase (luciferase family)
LEDVWVSGHIILPKDAPYAASPAFYDPVVLRYAAAIVTKRVRLGTSVLVVPMLHPLPLAKELAILQTMSGGRLIVSGGVGWLEASSPRWEFHSGNAGDG